MTPFTVEPMVPNRDLDAIVELEAASFTNPWTRQMFAWEIENSDVSRVYVLRTPDDPVAAFCSCWLIFEELHINTLAVRPALRRHGLATALMKEVLAAAAQAGARRATLEVRRSNEAALRLYERLGFTVAAARREYYTQPVEDALVLSREELLRLPT
jgi:ribosomal-protein-alanine N-acetyltransferase